MFRQLHMVEPGSRACRPPTENDLLKDYDEAESHSRIASDSSQQKKRKPPKISERGKLARPAGSRTFCPPKPLCPAESLRRSRKIPWIASVARKRNKAKRNKASFARDPEAFSAYAMFFLRVVGLYPPGSPTLPAEAAGYLDDFFLSFPTPLFSCLFDVYIF